MQMPSRHTRLRGGRPWGFSSSAGPSNNPYENDDGSSDDSVIPSEHVRRMLEGSESESFMATSPSVTSVESIPTREMEGSDSSVETDPSEDLDEFEDDEVETSAESDEVVPLVALGGSFGNVPITDFVVVSDNCDDDFSDESEEQMATGFLFGDSDIDEPMWEGPDGVLYEFNSDDSWQPGVHANPYYYPPTPDSMMTLDSFNSMSLGTDFGVSDAPSKAPDVEFATPPSPPTPNFVEISSDSELSDADELGDGVPFSNNVKSEPTRMSISPRRFASRTCSMTTMIENMIVAGTLGIEPIRPPEGMPVWNERMRRSVHGTVVTELEREDGRRSEPYSVTPFCFTCGQDGHYPRACPYVRHYHPYSRPYVICYECGGEGHYATVCPRKRPKNPGPSSPSPSTPAKKKKNLSIK
ncbi:Zinc finger CCHC-type superfamily [Arabidopsis thaliana x Arabidopsis arenosa]|uniref:Zinc finger CCHC-type superfamily n=1 Tax=Arabidopsis thaliana x Arabidopsis arenosa TaxID=1240361 RepID=A0A8T1Z0C0_9BRAS|nr:Zinc finger CCHC-type superfamily [Arabidopsis thaliana x Arabidopsis arenosa]